MEFIERIDPELVPTFLAFPAGGTINWSDLPATRQQFAAFLVTLTGDVPDDPTVIKEDHTIPGPPGAPAVFVRSYRPRDVPEPLPGMLWIHGGGMVLGSVAGNDLAVQRLVAATGCLAVSVEYRLAPEHPFPGMA